MNILEYISRRAVRVSIEVGSNYQLLAMNLTMFRVDKGTVPAGDTIFGQILPLASNTNGSLWENVLYYTSNDPNRYIAGLHLIYNVPSNNSHIFSIP